MATTMSRPAPPPLDTPASATFPSELKNITDSPPVVMKVEEPERTPITPPAAYLDFLAKRSSRTISPPSSATFSSVLFEKPSLTSNPSTDSVTTEATVQTITTEKESIPENTESEPPARTDSPDSQTSNRSNSSTASKDATIDASKSKAIARVDSSARPQRINTGPISPFNRMPDSGRNPRRLCIPQSPYSPRVVTPLTPGGAIGLVSPATSSIMSPVASLVSPGGTLLSPYSSSAFSPKDTLESPRNLTLKHVVTRTVTIARPAAPTMEPVPACKKRRIEGPTSSS